MSPHRTPMPPDSSPCEDSPIQESGTTPSSALKTGCTIAGIVLSILVLFTTLTLISCVSFLVTCDANPAALVEYEATLAEAKEKACAYWEEKYGEAADPSEVDFARYYSGEWAHDDKTEVLVNMGEKASYDKLVLVETDTGRISDNYQAKKIQEALDRYVKDELTAICETSGGTLIWATPASNLAAMPSDYTPLTDEEWEAIQTPASRLFDIYSPMTREEADAERRETWEDALAQEDTSIEPIVFNMEDVYEATGALSFSDDAPVSCGMFFSTYFDGTIESFIEAEKDAGHLEMEITDTIIVAAAVDDVALNHSSTSPYSWQATADALDAWLCETFDGKPEVVVAPTFYARRQMIEGNARLASYAALRWIEDADLYAERVSEHKAVYHNWVYLDEATSIRLESVSGGVMLRASDLIVKKSAASAEQVNEALARIDDTQVIIEGDIYELQFSDRVRELLEEPSGDYYDSALQLRFALDTGVSKDVANDWQARADEPHLYAYEVRAVAADGAIENADEGELGWQLAADALCLGDGTPENWGLYDGTHTVLIFVGTRASS